MSTATITFCPAPEASPIDRMAGRAGAALLRWSTHRSERRSTRVERAAVAAELAHDRVIHDHQLRTLTHVSGTR